jgi:hypothetical protein
VLSRAMLLIVTKLPASPGSAVAVARRPGYRSPQTGMRCIGVLARLTEIAGNVESAGRRQYLKDLGVKAAGVAEIRDSSRIALYRQFGLAT